MLNVENIEHSTFSIQHLQFVLMSVPLFFALYCLEAGLFFVILPWTRLWTLNPLLHTNVTMSLFAGDPFVRGFISGFGVVHLIVGVKDILRISQNRHRRPPEG
jgi:hypothetical protein